jgi:hypothetical protein
MAHDKVTGKPRPWFEKERREYDGDEPFHMQYCMAEIPRLPPDYDGPPRYCRASRGGGGEQIYSVGDTRHCRFHGGKGGGAENGNPENLDPLANMKHGMDALRRNLVEDFDDKDRALYDWIVNNFTEAYDLDPQGDPQVAYDLHRYAAEIVRAERGRGYLIEEGEISEQEVRDDNGMVVIDEHGDVVTKKSEHYLHSMLHQQDNKLSKMAKSLGIERRDRLKRDQTDDAVEAITEGFTELGDAFLSRDEQEYDPDKDWNDE